MSNLGTLIDGRYSASWNAVDPGFTEDGYDLVQGVREEVIDESDLYGGSIIDYFYRGGNCQLRCDSKEYKSGSTAPYWPWGGGAMGSMVTALQPVGVRASDAGKPLVLTSTPNTPAAIAPATLTATYAILAPGQQSTLKFTSKLRRVPIFLQLLPYTISGGIIWYQMT